MKRGTNNNHGRSVVTNTSHEAKGNGFFDKEVPPFEVAQLRRLEADSIDGYHLMSQWDCITDNIDYHDYKRYIAQKIARSVEDEHIKNAYTLLDIMPDSWRVVLNDQNKLIGYWAFIALSESAYEIVCSGEFSERDIDYTQIRMISIADTYKGYLLISGTKKDLHSPDMDRFVYETWLTYIQELSQKGIYFDEIATMVSSVPGQLMLNELQMVPFAKYRYGGTMFKYDLKNVEAYPYLCRAFPKMVNNYRKWFNAADIDGSGN